MSTATSALRSHDHAAYPEPIVRRRRDARARRPFSLVRGVGAGSIVRRPAPVPPPLVARPEISRGPATEVFAAYGTDGLAAARDVLVAASARPVDAELDRAFATVPQTEAPRRTREPARTERGPRQAGRRTDAALYDRVPGARQARGVHPVRRVEQAQIGFAALAVAALVTAIVVVAFLGLAHLRAGSFGDRFEPANPGISQSVDAGTGGLSGTVN
ncbi:MULTISPECIES: hypothetical protein [unclassified Nocardia]|uniref:hypothetical protein n=1 Tax=unclassified Nocardia TaxID=2637762 RepID=UPI00339E6C59